MKRQVQRQTYDGSDVGLPEIETFGWTSTSRATDLGLKPHRHTNAYEICLITGGSVQWWVGHEIYQLGRGDIYITHPNEPHGGIDEVMHPCALYWLILPVTPTNRSLPGLTHKQTSELFGQLEGMSRRTFKCSSDLTYYFKQMHSELQKPSTFQPVYLRATLHHLLIQLLRDHDVSQTSHDTSHRTPSIRKAMQWIANHLDDDATVEEIAMIAGLGVSRFHERFVAEVGLTPADYRTHLRIRRGQHLLGHTNQTITRISFDLGFSTSQYFATVFKKIVGMTPGAYRQSRSTDHLKT
ncbi:MAG TPA: hypothetical protein DCM28_00985 [Phycisphaerales bacterium]|nr:hypothetical protein [Phycisphaerales bacterium]HCD32377.1 hypothetical protein [Phycisphaerales bacterium]|tara:strand:- start:2015 stop:2902 length:888 start_codon:yes stop_codon:yes gene_type:complete